MFTFQALQLLKCSLQSNAALTEVFLEQEETQQSKAAPAVAAVAAAPAVAAVTAAPAVTGAPVVAARPAPPAVTIKSRSSPAEVLQMQKDYEYDCLSRRPT